MANSKLRLIALYTGAGVDVSDQFANFEISAADPDAGFLTFASARDGGGDDWLLKAKIPQDYTAGSVWSEMWDNPGEEWSGYYTAGTTDVVALADASAGTPVFGFTAVISRPRGAVFGGEASKAINAVPTVDIEWKLTGEPVKHTTDPTD
jgi:hypothetical protein